MGAQASQASNSVDDTAIKEGRASFGSDPLGLKGSMGCCAARSKPSKDYPAHRGVQVAYLLFCFLLWMSFCACVCVNENVDKARAL